MMIVMERRAAGDGAIVGALQESREMEMNSGIDLWQTTPEARLAVLPFERKE